MTEYLKNIRTILHSADLVYQENDYTSATILYFKVLFSVTDVVLLQKTGKTPKDHAERFRMLEDADPELYGLIDKLFGIYRDTYSSTITKATCEEVRNHVTKTIEKYRIPIKH